ncbi:MAG: hypothetical protein H0X22_03380 [Acidimicrobiia bacterium]|jgi:hypothetical protein|nr:hypothetical protein [Acidimicrobiia bacterium]
MHGDSAALRLRANEMRQVAVMIESSSVMTLDRHAGEETVIGSRFDALLDELRLAQQQLFASVDELRWRAYCLERDADDLDMAAARAATLGVAGVA